MPQIKLPSLTGEHVAESLKILERGLAFGRWTPTLVDMTTPAEVLAMYQLCGRVCMVSIKLSYVGIMAPSWGGSNSISMPIQVSDIVSNMAQPVLNIAAVNDVTFAEAGHAHFDTAHGGRYILQSTGPHPKSGEIYIVSGFYWVD